MAIHVPIAGLVLSGFEVLKPLGNALHGSKPSRSRSRQLSASVLALATGLAFFDAPDAHATPPAGQLLYRRYCGACHGLDGRGDGPVAPALSPPPTDLTRLETAIPDLMRQIDGRRTIRAHGTAAMPVWGEVFEQSLLGEPHKRRTALLQVQTLADYVHGLRHTETKE